MARARLFITGAFALAAALGAPPAHAQMAACTSASVKSDPNDQIRLYTICIEGGLRSSDRGGAYNNRGVAYMEIGDYDHAFSDFERSIRNDPDFAMAYFNRAVIYAFRGEAELAIADIETAVRYPPARIRKEAYTMSGQLRASLGDYAGALADFDEAIGRRPRRDPAPKLAKAWLLATCPDPAHRDGAEAVELAEAAVERDETWNAQEVLAAAYAEAGRFEDAVRTQQTAVSLQSAEGDDTAAFRLIAHLALYQDGHPYHAAGTAD